MKFILPVHRGIILKRYKRFLADIKLDGGELITAHLANTGSMTSCYQPSWPALLTYHDNPKRKLKYSLEMIHNGQSWIGVNTSRTNSLAVEAIKSNIISELASYHCLKTERQYRDSRIDLYLHDEEQEQGHWVEIKSVTLKVDDGIATFPDAVTKRGQKHLLTLIDAVKRGYRASLLFIVQREDVTLFDPSRSHDMEYFKLLQSAHQIGVNILVYQCQLSEQGITVYSALPYKV
ncbi:MAG: DNA/RNA nuclease SfsA [Bdellovibrionales bacterium]|nr:DNA/RNA nuclease SfsA [Bdellovibrionales bacterium]